METETILEAYSFVLKTLTALLKTSGKKLNHPGIGAFPETTENF